MPDAHYCASLKQRCEALWKEAEAVNQHALRESDTAWQARITRLQQAIHAYATSQAFMACLRSLEEPPHA